MRDQTRCRAIAWTCALAAGTAAHAQFFSLDDNPSIPFAGPPVPPFWSAEDPYGIGTPPVAALGIGGPSPSLAFGYIDGMILGPAVPGPPHLVPPNGTYLNAVSPNRRPIGPDRAPKIALDFSVDRGTQGLPGSALFGETVGLGAGPLGVQQSGDIYRSTLSFTHPGFFAGTLAPGILPPVPTFGGVLPTAGIGGSNSLIFDESVLGLTVAGAPGLLTPPGVIAPAPPFPLLHDNVDAYSNTAMDTTGDAITDVEFFFAIAPAESVLVGLSPSDIFDVGAGAPGSPGVPYAPAPASGMDSFGTFSDDIDALVVWDHGAIGGPGFGGPGAEPVRDYALFSLGEGSATLGALIAAGVPVNGSTIFFTDFTGAFAIYALDIDIGVDPFAAGFFAPYANVDALDIVPAPPTLGLVALLGLAGARRRR